MKIIGRAAASARSELGGSSTRAAWSRAGLLAIASAILLIVLAYPSAPRADGTFNPTITLQTSTTRATAHPDARITIDNTASSENIKDLKVSLPDGFWGSLGAVPYKCSESDATAGTCGDNAPESKIGTVTATADIADTDPNNSGTTVDGVLTGDVYLTDPFTGNDDPAGVSIVVHAKVGGVDLGQVIINGRAEARTQEPSGFTGVAPDLVGLDTVVNDIPQSITDSHSRTVDYKVNKMQLDLISKLQDPSNPDPTWGYLPPLLTNPSRCGTYEIAATATPYGGGADANISDDYTVDQCDTAHFDPQMTNTFSNDPDNQTPADPLPVSTALGLFTHVEFPAATNQPDSNSSLSSFKIMMPRGMGPNFGAYVGACPSGSITQIGSRLAFTPGSCPSYAKIGEAYIYTPLLPPGQPMLGYVYLVDKHPMPQLVIAATEDLPGNLPGINIYLAGESNLEYTDPGTTTDSRVTFTMNSLPDTPITSIDVNLEMGTRHNGPTAIPGEFVKMPDDGISACQAQGEVVSEFSSSSGASRAGVQSYDTTCTGAKITPGSGPWGQMTTDDSPTFDFTYSGSQANIWCGVETIATTTDDCKPSLSFSASNLSDGPHSLLLGDGNRSLGNKSIVRDFVVQPDLNYDTVVPDTTMTAGPGHGGSTEDTSDSTPQFSFNSSETSSFQCSLDGGAFLPCGSASGTATADYTIPDADSMPASDTVHTFAVRAQDTAGNVDLTPASADFKIVKPFDPTVAVSLTTLQARAHPEMTVTIGNDSHEDIKDLYLNMPDGFFGGLTGVQSLCSTTDAANGDCSAGSQVGTVDATALIDRSTAHITGKVFLTDPQIPNIGEPAGLTIDLEPKLQGVTFNPIRINARLSTRGEAQGINTATVNIPNTAESTLNEVSDFDVQQMVLKLKDNNAAPQHLLTNPSYCGTGTFAATFNGYDSSTSSSSPTVDFTGCGALSFAPSLGLNFTDHTTHQAPGEFSQSAPVRADLSATLTTDASGSGIRNADILLPKGLTIDPAKIPPPCQPADYPDNCPAATQIGTVSAVSPLLSEAVQGNVYMLKAPGLPKIFLRLRGRINANLVATNYTINNLGTNSQIETKFVDLPDVPISSFTMNITGFLLTTTDNACDFGPDEWNAVSTLTGWNGKVSTGVNAVQFDCPNVNNPTFQIAKWSPRKAKSTLSLYVRPQAGRTDKKVTVKLPKGTKFVKSAFSKKKIGKSVSVATGEGNNLRTIKSKCFKIKSTTTFEVGFCGKASPTVMISFKKGSITTKSKSKKLKLKVTTVNDKNVKQTAKQL